MKTLTLFTLLAAAAAAQQTYAERLGYPKDARVLILHTDDAGMSLDSNLGVEAVVERGAAKSLSVMMPCPWVPNMVRYIKSHPEVDAGLHLTLTSEWREYRWAPLSAAPGLIDPEGAMWRSVADVIKHAKPEEVDREIRAQVDRAINMGFQPTHLDSHMGTLFASPAFFEKYIRLGIEKQIPVMMPGGHNTYLRADAGGNDDRLPMMRKVGEQLWAAGLPVLDDLHNTSYGWKVPKDMKPTDENLRRWRSKLYMDTLRELKPGLTMVIMHCTFPTEVFAKISDSGDIRKADMLAMTDPEFQAFLKREGFIMTTWREAHARRKQAK